MDVLRPAWSTLFGRVRLPGGLFTVKPPYQRQVLERVGGLGLPEATKVEYRMPAVRAVAYLDGAVVDLGSYGFGGLTPGVRVIGWHAMRHLCLEMSAAPPSRALKGEPPLPTEQQLREEFRLFLASSREQLAARAETALFRDPLDLLFSVRGLLGDSVLPALTGETDQDRWPATGVWGDKEFSRGSARAMVSAGVAVEDAVEIRRLLCADRPVKNARLLDDWDSGYLLSAAEVGLEELRRWTDTTVPMRFVADLVKLDITADQAREMQKHDGLTGFDLFDRLRRDAWARATG